MATSWTLKMSDPNEFDNELDTFIKRERPDSLSELEDKQIEAAKTAVEQLVASGAFGDKFNISVTGHTNVGERSISIGISEV